jgi:cell division protein FtsI (penicillin-binding protein 3)
VVDEYPVRVLDEKICKQATVDTLRSFMEEVALTGTAEMFFGPKASPFRVGGKTGTAQVAQTIGTRQITYKDRYYLGSMVIYLPADNPKYTILTAICKKRGVGSYYGSTLAGPVQKRIATFLYNRDVGVPHARLQSDEKHHPDCIKGGNIDHMSRVAREYSADTEVSRGGKWGACTTVDGAAHIGERAHKAGTMPDVRGMGLADALFLLEAEGLKVEVEGVGGVAQQSIAAGSSIAIGDKVKIVLK